MNRFVLRKFCISKVRLSGRNSFGHITIRGRGGGLVDKVVLLDFWRSVKEVPGKVRKVFKSPGHTGFVGVILFRNGLLSCQVLPEGLSEGHYVFNSLEDKQGVFLGSGLFLRNFPLGSIISLIQPSLTYRMVYCRSAGSGAKLLKKDPEKGSLLELPSGEQRWFGLQAFGTLGYVSNINHKFMKLKKAGERRILGFRPKVRGVAMNPVDHPHGGGEGRTSGGRCSVSPQGRLTKGKKTAKSGRRTKSYIYKSH